MDLKKLFKERAVFIKDMMTEKKLSREDKIVLIPGYRPDNKQDYYTYGEYLDVYEGVVTEGHVYDMIVKTETEYQRYLKQRNDKGKIQG